MAGAQGNAAGGPCGPLARDPGGRSLHHSGHPEVDHLFRTGERIM